jgi:hypothetical protein
MTRCGPPKWVLGMGLTSLTIKIALLETFQNLGLDQVKEYGLEIRYMEHSDFV